MDPEWVSIQHATVVCIGCAGEHRALGPALSHIRSLRFDTLSKNELAAMHAGGNAKLRVRSAGQPGLSADVLAAAGRGAVPAPVRGALPPAALTAAELVAGAAARRRRRSAA